MSHRFTGSRYLCFTFTYVTMGSLVVLFVLYLLYTLMTSSVRYGCLKDVSGPSFLICSLGLLTMYGISDSLVCVIQLLYTLMTSFVRYGCLKDVSGPLFRIRSLGLLTMYGISKPCLCYAYCIP